jgi:hypothetical protein
MTYVKPSIAALGIASEAIQFAGDKGGHHLDGIVAMQPNPSTGTAYDLDE